MHDLIHGPFSLNANPITVVHAFPAYCIIATTVGSPREKSPSQLLNSVNNLAGNVSFLQLLAEKKFRSFFLDYGEKEPIARVGGYGTAFAR